MTSTQSASSAPHRRRWPLVLGALALVLALVLALAPTLLGGFAAGIVRDGFAADREGRLEIDALELGWTGRQQVRDARLLAPDGSEVARVSAELPSLLDLATGGGSKLGKISVRAQATLVADDSGVTNLDRALALRAGRETEPEPASPSEPSTDLGKLLAELDLELEVTVVRAEWSDARTRLAGRPFAVENLVATVRARPGEPVRVQVDGALSGDEPGRIAVSVALHDLLAGAGVNPQARLELDARLDSIPSAFIDALAQQPGLLAAAFGPQFKVAAQAEGTLASGKLDLRVAGERGAVVFQGALADGMLGRDEPATLQVSLHPEAEALARLLGSHVPEGLTLEMTGAPQVELAITGLRIGVQPVVDAASQGGDVVAAAIGQSEFALRLSTQGWRASGALVPLEQGVSLEALRAEVALAPQGEARVLTAQLETQLGAGASGFVSSQVRIEDLARFLAGDPALLIESRKGDEPRFDVTLALQQLESSTLAAFAPEGVDVEELLGRALDLRVDLTNGRGRREAIVRATSPTLAVDLAAWMENGELVQPGDEPWTIRFHPPAGALQRAAAPFVPEGITLAPGRSLSVRVAPGLRVPLKELGTATDPAALFLRRANVEATVELDALAFSDTASRAIDLRSIALGLQVRRGADVAPLLATLSARLGSEPTASIQLRAGCAQPGSLDALADVLALPALEFELVADDFPLRSLDAGAGGPDSLVARLGALADLALRGSVKQQADAPLAAALVLDGKFEKAQLGLQVDATVEDPFERKGARPAGTLPPLEAKVRASGLRSLQGFLPADLGASVVDLAGDELSADVSVRPVDGAAGDLAVSAQLSAERVSLVADLSLVGKRLALGSRPTEIVVRPTEGVLQRHAAASLPAGATLALGADDARLLVRIEALDLPLAMLAPDEGVEPSSLADVVRATTVRAHVELPSVRYAQAADASGAGVASLSVQSVDVDATLEAGKPALAQLSVRVEGPSEGSIGARATVADAGSLLELGSGPLPQVSASVEMRGLQAFRAFVPPELADSVFELAGDSLDLQIAHQQAGADASELELRLDAKALELAGLAQVRDSVLRIEGKPLTLTVRPSDALLERHVGASLPAGAKLVLSEPEPRVSVRIESLSLPLDAWLVAEGQGARSLGDVVRRALARLRVELPAVRYTHPPVAEGTPGAAIDLRELAIDASLAGTQPATVDVVGKVGGASAGAIAVKASVADVAGFVERAEGAPLPTTVVQGDLTGMPTALIDALAAQDGLLVDVLGPTVNAKLSGAWPSATDPLRAELRSAHASVVVVARLDEQLLVAVEQQGIDAQLPLSPLFSRRIVGNLVPLFVNASKPEGARPVGLRVSAFQLPLDGDLRKLNGTVDLDLGEISYEFLPGLGSALDALGAGEFARKTSNLKSLTIPIRDGVAGYTALPISIQGQEYPFTGTYDIAKGEMKFAASLPLSVLGKSVTKELDKVRDYVNPQTLVPLEIVGAWSSPSVRLGKGFVEKLLKDAAEGALKKGLDDLFGKKKDKK